MRKLGLLCTSFVSTCLLTLLVAGQARADYVDSVVLIPDVEGAFNTFDGDGDCSGDHSDCVNDSNDTVCGPDTLTELSFTSGYVEQYRYTTASDTTWPPDSMSVNICLAELKSGTGGDTKVEFGWRYKESGDWYYCTREGGTDTVDLNSKNCASFRVSYDNDPCEDVGEITWIRYGGFYDDETETYAWQPVAHVVSLEAGCLGGCSGRMFNLWHVIYFTVVEEEGESDIIRRRLQWQRVLNGEDANQIGEWWPWIYDSKKGVVYVGDENEICPNPWTDDWFLPCGVAWRDSMLGR